MDNLDQLDFRFIDSFTPDDFLKTTYFANSQLEIVRIEELEGGEEGIMSGL